MRAAFLDAWFREKPKVAVARLDSATRAAPPLGPSSVELDFELARIYAVAGAPDRARTFLKEADAGLTDSAARRRTQSRRVEIEGEIALAERRTQDAIQSFRRSDVAGDGLPQQCPFCLPALLGRAYDQGNNADSTIANLERYITSPGASRINIDQWFLAAAYKRLGELYEARGDVARAVTSYAAFVNLWQRADPDLQPKVAEVRARVERLRRTLPQ
jgi:tetratricopeptide (TPR) repeat protein